MVDLSSRLDDIDRIFEVGTSRSGNYGHKGRPGIQGGSAYRGSSYKGGGPEISFNALMDDGSWGAVMDQVRLETKMILKKHPPKVLSHLKTVELSVNIPSWQSVLKHLGLSDAVAGVADVEQGVIATYINEASHINPHYISHEIGHLAWHYSSEAAKVEWVLTWNFSDSFDRWTGYGATSPEEGFCESYVSFVNNGGKDWPGREEETSLIRQIVGSVK